MPWIMHLRKTRKFTKTYKFLKRLYYDTHANVKLKLSGTVDCSIYIGAKFKCLLVYILTKG